MQCWENLCAVLNAYFEVGTFATIGVVLRYQRAPMHLRAAALKLVRLGRVPGGRWAWALARRRARRRSPVLRASSPASLPAQVAAAVGTDLLTTPALWNLAQELADTDEPLVMQVSAMVDRGDSNDFYQLVASAVRDLHQVRGAAGSPCGGARVDVPWPVGAHAPVPPVRYAGAVGDS